MMQTVQRAKDEWLSIQADFIQRWLSEGKGFQCEETSDQLDASLVVGTRERIKTLRVLIEGAAYTLVLFKDEIDDKKKLNFYWYTTQALPQPVQGVTYLVAESDITHQLFKQLDTRTTILEWGQFEDLLHVATTDETEARYILAPDVMARVYDAWVTHQEFLGRVRFSGDRAALLTGLHRIEERDENKTLLDDDMPEKILSAHTLLRTLAQAVLASKAI